MYLNILKSLLHIYVPSPTFFQDTVNAITVSVKGSMDPGYGSTSKMIAEAAVCLGKDDFCDFFVYGNVSQVLLFFFVHCTKEDSMNCWFVLDIAISKKKILIARFA